MTLRLLAACALLVPAIAQASGTGSALPVPPPSIRDHVRGRRNAPVTVIVYSDLECPFCQNHHRTMKDLIRKKRGKVSVIFRHFPLDFHANALPAALAAECVFRTDGAAAYWAYIDRVFDEGTSTYRAIADAVTTNKTALASCIAQGTTGVFVQSQKTAAFNAGVSGTPTTFLYHRKTGQWTTLAGAQPLEGFVYVVNQWLK